MKNNEMQQENNLENQEIKKSLLTEKQEGNQEIKKNLLTEKQVQYLGYLASAFLILSFFFTDINLSLFFVLNIIACVIFIIYAYLLGKVWPIIITNIFIGILDVYKLINLY